VAVANPHCICSVRLGSHGYLRKRLSLPTLQHSGNVSQCRLLVELAEPISRCAIQVYILPCPKRHHKATRHYSLRSKHWTRQTTLTHFHSSTRLLTKVYHGTWAVQRHSTSEERLSTSVCHSPDRTFLIPVRRFLTSDVPGAKADLQESLVLNPALTQSLVKLASVHMEEGDNKRALESFERAIEVDPSDPDVYYHRGQGVLKFHVPPFIVSHHNDQTSEL